MSTPYITVTGHLGKDPDVKTGASGKPYANLFIIANTSRRNPQTNECETTESWVSGVTVFGDLAQACSQLAKGMRVTVTGRLVTESYQAQDGSQKSAQKLLASEIAVSLLGQSVSVQRNQPQPGGFQQQGGFQSNGFAPQGGFQQAPQQTPAAQATPAADNTDPWANQSNTSFDSFGGSGFGYTEVTDTGEPEF